MEEGMHKVKSEMFILSRNPWPVPALVFYSVWGTPRHPSLHPLSCQDTLCTENRGTTPAQAYFSFSCPNGARPA